MVPLDVLNKNIQNLNLSTSNKGWCTVVLPIISNTHNERGSWPGGYISFSHKPFDLNLLMVDEGSRLCKVMGLGRLKIEPKEMGHEL